MRPPIPVSTLKNLRCGHCRKFVTCGPVHVTPDSSILCGRCARFAKNNFRNISFEAIASLYRYPCEFWSKHCNERLSWNESLNHERQCLFQSKCNVFCSRPGTYFKSDRKLPHNTEIHLEHINDEIIQDLKCVVCELYLSNGPVYIVMNGKNICHRCSHSNGVPKGGIRNLAYETIANSTIFPCIYRLRGCTIRLKFGRDMWGHETECPYGQVQQKFAKNVTKVGKDGKERGVIETHSGHIWGTITPHSALFAPPKTKHNDGQMVTQELTEIMKKKHQEEVKGFDAQSMDSAVSRASTFDSIGDFPRSMGDNISRDNISRSTVDNISRDNVSRTTVDNISRDNVSRDNVSRDNVSRDNVSRDNISRSSARLPPQDEHRGYSNEGMLDDNNYRQSVSGKPHGQPGPSNYDMQRQRFHDDGGTNYRPSLEVAPLPTPTKLLNYDIQRQRSHDDGGMNYRPSQEVAPLPTPTGFNKIPYNGYYHENMARYGRPSQFEPNTHLYHYPPVYYDNNSNLNYSASFSYAPNPSQIPPKRSESFRVGNKDLIDELKERHNKKQNQPHSTSEKENPYNQCNSLQDLVQKHDEVFN